jgi:hypothetical protein
VHLPVSETGSMLLTKIVQIFKRRDTTASSNRHKMKVIVIEEKRPPATVGKPFAKTKKRKG